MENAEYSLVKVCAQLLISKKLVCHLVMVIFYAMTPAMLLDNIPNKE